jgi:Flp pilus assembly protein TadB
MLYAGILIAGLALVFFFWWWRKRAARTRQGDFAALVEQRDAAQALAAQAESPWTDAAQAWQQTKHTMENVKTGVERSLALIWALLSALLCAISMAAVVSDLWKFPAINWGSFAFYAVLAAVCAWFTRLQWRDFRGRK